MPDLVLPNTLTEDTTAYADEVMANFVAIRSKINGNIDSDNLAADSVTASEIAAGAVGSSELADNAVDTGAVQSAAVTSPKMNPTVLTDTLGGTQDIDNLAGTASAVLAGILLTHTPTVASKALVIANFDFELFSDLGGDRISQQAVGDLVVNGVAYGNGSAVFEQVFDDTAGGAGAAARATVSYCWPNVTLATGAERSLALLVTANGTAGFSVRAHTNTRLTAFITAA
jgi:hypothetical protein